MANAPLTTQELTRDTLMILQNRLKIVQSCYRDADSSFGRKGEKIGDTLYQRKPSRSVGRDGQAFQPEPLIDTQVPIVINQQSGYDFQMSSFERKLSFDEITKRYLRPGAIAIANKLDYRAGQTVYQNTSNNVGTPGVTPGLSGSDSFLTYSQANELLDMLGFQDETDRVNIMSSKMQTGWNVFSKAFFNPDNTLSKQWKTGQISNALGQQMFVDENVPRHTIGALGGTPAVNGANQTGNTLIIDGVTASITNWGKIGDVFTIANVYSVNPQSRVSNGTLQQFVLQAAASSDSGSAITLVFSPAIAPSGQFQNVDSTPADNALISIFGVAAAGQGALAGTVTTQGLIVTPQAYAFAAIRFDVPGGTNEAYIEDAPEVMVPLRYVSDWSVLTDSWASRFDCGYGISPMYSEGAVRVNAA